jgi:hypothetical protein
MAMRTGPPIAGWKLTACGAALFAAVLLLAFMRAPLPLLITVALVASWVGVPMFVVGIVRVSKAALNGARAASPDDQGRTD